MKNYSFDERRDLVIYPSQEEAIDFAAQEWIRCAQASIADHGFFAVALSGGSTPKAIYQKLSSPPCRSSLPWEKVLLFWSDERAVPPDHPDSNFHMAMHEGGLATLPLLPQNIFRMVAENNIEEQAALYERCILDKLGPRLFDLVMLGMGEDGHTASLFPHTQALFVLGRLVTPNFIPSKNTFRMTLTFECINRSLRSHFYILGAAKSAIVAHVLTSTYSPEDLPSQRIGTQEHKALFILDANAATHLHLKT